VASLQFDKASGRFRIRFYCGDTEYKRSLQTKDEAEAQAVKVRVEETLRLIERGRLEIRPGADPARLVLSDGKLIGKPVIEQVLTLDDLFTLYRKALPEGAKEKNTITTERLHCKHLLRILGSQVAAQELCTTDFQKYADQRSQEKGRRGKVRPPTIKKELDTLRVIWNWAVSRGHLRGSAPIKGITFAKGKEKMPFQTWDGAWSKWAGAD
jgi:hypothetical protein